MEIDANVLLDHFSLTEEPFGAPANPHFLFKGQVYEETLAMLELGIATRRGLIVIVGEVGTGKTTVAKTIVKSAGPKAHVAYIGNSTLGFMDLLREAFAAWGVPEGRTKGQMITNLREFAAQRTEDGEVVALIVDEAQALSDTVFEELWQLLNLETPEYKLVQVILLGQPELRGRLLNPRFRHVADRVAMYGHTRPLKR